MNLFNLFATLTLDNSEYEKKINESRKSAASVSSKMGTAFKTAGRVIGGVVTAVAAVTTAISALAVKTVDYMGDIDNNAQRVGMSTEAYQKWAYAMQLAGGDANTLQIVMRELTTFTNELSAGQGDALLTLQELGIGYEEFMALPVDQQLQAIIEGLQSMENQTDKTALAQEIFGNRAYQQLMPILNQEKGYVDDLFESMEDLGLVIGDDVVKAGAALGNKLNQLKLTFKTVGASIMSDLFPQIELVVEGLTGMATGAEDAGDKFVEGIVGIVDKLTSALPNLIEIAGNLLVEVLSGIISALPSMVPNIIEVLEALLFKVVEILPTLTQSIFDIAVALVKAWLNVDWGTLLINLLEALIDIMLVQFPTMLLDMMFSLVDTVFDLFFTKNGQQKLLDFGKRLIEVIGKGVLETIPNLLEMIWDFIGESIGGIAGLFGGENASSSVTNWFDNTGNSIGNWFDNAGNKIKDFFVEDVGGAFKKAGNWIKDLFTGKLFADGGMITAYDNGGLWREYPQGTLYALAGEAGAEIVAHGPRGTGVANVEQIADAQYMAMNEYDVKGEIQRATVAIVNGITNAINGAGGATNVSVRIGDREFKNYVVQVVNDTLKAQGRKTLNTITAY